MTHPERHVSYRTAFRECEAVAAGEQMEVDEDLHTSKGLQQMKDKLFLPRSSRSLSWVESGAEEEDDESRDTESTRGQRRIYNIC